ncbi:glycosyltransferase family 4 protein [Lacticaseibacillus brantae]|uniref:Teichoic acid polysaccharide glycosyl transferase n=1 Tax=Lacticaseibacillus brantae DSM 23927 TaxID=1423727 RepID=A0A0R2B216_9LACO|nr:glycosyltransferase family 4 protein [Lacticaseibacillus brantae]KRM73114.1 teichoic acid polysaccharide glycosyl transferase [Lacticaseibacillus brantae DSM 23927]
MKVLHINAGLENGGGLTHIVSLLKGQPDVELLTFADGSVAAAAREAGISVHVLAHQSRYSLSILKELRQFIGHGHYDIVHSHGARANLFMRMIHRRVLAKWVITVHSDPTLDFMNGGVAGRIFTRLNIASLKRADQVDVVTKTFAAEVAHLGVPTTKIRVIYNGIAFHSTPVMAQPHPTFTMMMVARLHPVKDHALLLHAFKAAQLPAQLNVVGDGPMHDAIQTMIQDLGLAQQVHMLGFKTPEEIRGLQATTDVNLLTSQSESFPLVLLESADAGVPVIATNVGDMQVMIPDAKYGQVVPVGDVDALASAMATAYQRYLDQTLQAEGQRFRDYAMAHFSIAQLQAAVWAGYSEILKK